MGRGALAIEGGTHRKARSSAMQIFLLTVVNGPTLIFLTEPTSRLVKTDSWWPV